MHSATPVSLERHCSCKHYVTGKCNFSTERISAGESYAPQPIGRLSLIFIESQDSYFCIQDGIKEHRTEPYVLFVDRNHSISVEFKKEGRASIFYFDKLTKLCNSFSIIKLRSYVPAELTTLSLPILYPLEIALASIVKYYEDGLKCEVTAEAKLQEIFFVLGSYYRPEDLGIFLSPMLREEVSFKDFVMNNYSKVSTVKDLADLRGISLRVFNKLFKDAFNEPPYRWMLERKAIEIEERLKDPLIPFSEIIEEFRFSSPSHFTVFCHRQYGITPTEKRRQLMEEERRLRRLNNHNIGRY